MGSRSLSSASSPRRRTTAKRYRRGTPRRPARSSGSQSTRGGEMGTQRSAKPSRAGSIPVHASNPSLALVARTERRRISSAWLAPTFFRASPGGKGGGFSLRNFAGSTPVAWTKDGASPGAVDLKATDFESVTTVGSSPTAPTIPGIAQRQSGALIRPVSGCSTQPFGTNVMLT